MGLEDFQSLDNEPFVNSIIKTGYLERYHQQGANINDFDQNVEFIFGENVTDHQIGNACLEFDITVGNPTANFDNTREIRLRNNAFAYCFKEAFLSTNGGLDLEHVKYLGQVSTILRSISSKDGNL